MTPWNPWQLTTIAMMLVMATALVTGLVVANWSGSDIELKPAAPTQEAIAACNRYAESRLGQRDKTMEVVKNAAVGGVVGAGGGTLYGLNDTKKHDERYRETYASCMRSRGYTG